MYDPEGLNPPDDPFDYSQRPILCAHCDERFAEEEMDDRGVCWSCRDRMVRDAAPALLEALTEIVAWEYHDCRQRGCEDGCPYQLARTAIAKATGGSTR